jgi:hypothetical protein
LLSGGPAVFAVAKFDTSRVNRLKLSMFRSITFNQLRAEGAFTDAVRYLDNVALDDSITDEIKTKLTN